MKNKKIGMILAYAGMAALLLSGCAQEKKDVQAIETAAQTQQESAETASETVGTKDVTEMGGTEAAAESDAAAADEKDSTETATKADGTETAEETDSMSEADSSEDIAEADKTEDETSADDAGQNGIKEAAADFEASLLSGERIKLSDYQGRKVLLNFWATWCGPCVGEMPALQKLSEEYPDDLVVLAVNCGEDEKTVSQFIEKNGYTFPIALDEDLTIGNLYPGTAQGIPYTLLLDEEGNIMEESVGAADSDTMYQYYKENLELK